MDGVSPFSSFFPPSEGCGQPPRHLPAALHPVASRAFRLVLAPVSVGQKRCSQQAPPLVRQGSCALLARYEASSVHRLPALLILSAHSNTVYFCEEGAHHIIKRWVASAGKGKQRTQNIHSQGETRQTSISQVWPSQHPKNCRPPGQKFDTASPDGHRLLGRVGSSLRGPTSD